MDNRNNNGIYLDRDVLARLANNLYNGGQYYLPNDWNTINRMGNIQPGYYDLNSVPVQGLGNVNLYSILKRYW